MQSQNQIYSFILTLVPHWSDADDILQDTAEVLWRRYSQTQSIDNFTGLGIQVARNMIYTYYRRKKKKERFLDEIALDEIADFAQQACKDADERMRILHQCLSKLSLKDMELIRLRYEGGMKIKKLAEVCCRSEMGLAKALGRIHDALLRCIKQHFALENYS